MQRRALRKSKEGGMRVRYFSSSKRLFSLLLCAHGIVVQKWGSTKSRCGGGPLNAQSCWQQGLFTKGLLRLLLSLFPGSDYTHSRPCTRSGQCRQQHHWGKEKKMFLFFVPNNNTAANLHRPDSFCEHVFSSGVGISCSGRPAIQS